MDNRGEGRLKPAIWTAILILIVYGSVKLVPMYFKYMMMIYEVRAVVKNAHQYEDRKIYKNIMEKAVAWSLPIDRETVKVTRGYDTISISLGYEIEKSFFIKHKQVFFFNIDETGRIKSNEYR